MEIITVSLSVLPNIRFRMIDRHRSNAGNLKKKLKQDLVSLTFVGISHVLLFMSIIMLNVYEI